MSLDQKRVTEAYQNVAEVIRLMGTIVKPLPTVEEGYSDSLRTLAESIQGATAGICRIADSIMDLTEAVREHGGKSTGKGRKGEQIDKD